MRRIYTVIGLLIILSATSCDGWVRAKNGKPYGISGLALLSHNEKETTFLGVHDNKLKGEPRIAFITLGAKRKVKFEIIAWPDTANLPVDMESITMIPSEPDNFIGLASSGKFFKFRFDSKEKQITLLKTFDLPNKVKGSNFEGLAIQKLSDSLSVMLWAHRGQDSIPAVIYWNVYDPEFKFTNIGSVQLTTPYPTKNVRYISDLKIDESGAVYVISSSDPGDKGPFESAAYIAGSLVYENRELKFRKNREFVKFYEDNKHKIEAMELIPGKNGGVIYGSDDEMKGGSLYPTWWN